MKIKYFGLIFLVLFFSCTKEKTEIPKVNDILTESIETSVEPAAEHDTTVMESESNTLNIVGPIEKWGGITDVRELPEYVYMKVFWESRGQYWPTIEELSEKHGLKYEEINAETLNSAGYELYEKEQYPNAIALFRYAVLDDPEYSYAHYNLACSAALAIEDILEIFEGEGSFNSVIQQMELTDIKEPYSRENLLDLYKNSMSITDYFDLPYYLLDEVFNQLAVSFFLNSDYIAKSQTDPDLKIIQSMERFKYLINYAKEDYFWPFYGYFTVVGSKWSGNCFTMLDGRNYIADDIPDNTSHPFFEASFIKLHDEKKLNKKRGHIPVKDTSFGDSWALCMLNELGYSPWTVNYKVNSGDYYKITENSLNIYEIRETMGDGQTFVSGVDLTTFKLPLPLKISQNEIIFNENVNYKRVLADAFIPERYLK